MLFVYFAKNKKNEHLFVIVFFGFVIFVFVYLWFFVLFCLLFLVLCADWLFLFRGGGLFVGVEWFQVLNKMSSTSGACFQLNYIL